MLSTTRSLKDIILLSMLVLVLMAVSVSARSELIWAENGTNCPDIAISPDGDKIVVCRSGVCKVVDSEGHVVRIDISGSLPLYYTGNDGFILKQDNKLIFVNFNGKIIKEVPLSIYPSIFAVSPNLKYIALTLFDKTLNKAVVWLIDNNGNTIFRKELPYEGYYVKAIGVSNNGLVAVVISNETKSSECQYALVIDRNGQITEIVREDNPFSRNLCCYLYLSPSGKYLLLVERVVNPKNMIMIKKVYDLQSKRKICEIENPTGWIATVDEVNSTVNILCPWPLGGLFGQYDLNGNLIRQPAIPIAEFCCYAILSGNGRYYVVVEYNPSSSKYGVYYYRIEMGGDTNRFRQITGNAQIHVHKVEKLKTNRTTIYGGEKYIFKSKWTANIWKPSDNIKIVSYTITTTKSIMNPVVWELYNNGTERSYPLRPSVAGNSYTWQLNVGCKTGVVINFVTTSNYVEDSAWATISVNTVREGKYTKVNLHIKPITRISWANVWIRGEKIIRIESKPREFEIRKNTENYVKFSSGDLTVGKTYTFSVVVENPKEVDVWIKKSRGHWMNEGPSEQVTLSVDDLGSVTVRTQIPVIWEHYSHLPSYAQSFNIILNNETKSPKKGKVKLYDRKMHLIGVYQRIKDAVNNASPGYTIIVGDGEYTENIIWIDKSLTIRSENGSGTCIIKANNPYMDIFYVKADYVNISGFTIKGAHNASGIHLFCADHCKISNNVFLDNLYGLRLFQSCGNVIVNNNYSGNINGIYAEYYSIHNLIVNNRFTNNRCGVTFRDSYNNIVCLNDFINNKHNANANLANIWNSTEPVGYVHNGRILTGYLGNYWSNYRGNDSNNDGIGDIPYQINTNNKDYYPLTQRSSYYFSAISIPQHIKQMFISILYKMINQTMQELVKEKSQSSEITEQNTEEQRIKITEFDKKKLDSLKDLFDKSMKVYMEFFRRYIDDYCVKEQKKKLEILVADIDKAIKTGQLSENVSLLLNNVSMSEIDELKKLLSSSNPDDRLKGLLRVYELKSPIEGKYMELTIIKIIFKGIYEAYKGASGNDEELNKLKEFIKEIDQAYRTGDIQRSKKLNEFLNKIIKNKKEDNEKFKKIASKVSKYGKPVGKLIGPAISVLHVGLKLKKLNSDKPIERLEGAFEFYDSICSSSESLVGLIGIPSPATVVISMIKIPTKGVLKIAEGIIKEIEIDHLTHDLCVIGYEALSGQRCGVKLSPYLSSDFENYLKNGIKLYYNDAIYNIDYGDKYPLTVSIYSNDSCWIILYSPGKMPTDESVWLSCAGQYTYLNKYMSGEEISEIKRRLEYNPSVDSIEIWINGLYVGDYFVEFERPIPIWEDNKVKDRILIYFSIPKDNEYLRNINHLKLQIKLKWDSREGIWIIDTKENKLINKEIRTVHVWDGIVNFVKNSIVSISEKAKNIYETGMKKLNDGMQLLGKKFEEGKRWLGKKFEEGKKWLDDLKRRLGIA